MTKKKKPPRLAVIDAETDPFLYGRKPQVFAWGFFDGETYQDFWGTHYATDQLAQYLERYPEPLMIYAHNGGKFDFFYLIERGLVSNPIMLINGRVVKVGLFHHELRDSYSIIPVSLSAAGDKLKIDYEKFEESRREKHKAEILHYLAKDCEALYKLVAAFHGRFGPMLTVGSTAIKELGKLHPIRRGDEAHDERFRPFYYGGRVSVFEAGILEGAWHVYDVNSMYPHVMRNFSHPYGQKYLQLENTSIDHLGNIEGYPKRTYFAEIEATNRGALPSRLPDSLDFDCPEGKFYACSHEIRVALKHGLIDIHKVERAWVPLSLIKFDTFVDTFSAEKIAAKASGDKISELFSKFMLNSAYGKFGQNPAHYYDWSILQASERSKWLKARKDEAWEMAYDYGAWEIWRKPSPKPRYFDVAIAGSTTSGGRSILLDAFQVAARRAYGDTDSIICEGLYAVKHDGSQLGAWKLEAQGDLLAMAGKKMYALFDTRIAKLKSCRDARGVERCDGTMPCPRCGCVKMASKGADLEPADIYQLARGASIEWHKPSPTFKLGGEPVWIDRVLQKTV